MVSSIFGMRLASPVEQKTKIDIKTGRYVYHLKRRENDLQKDGISRRFRSITSHLGIITAFSAIQEVQIMRQPHGSIWLFLALLCVPSIGLSSIHHHLKVTIEPVDHTIAAVDTIVLGAEESHSWSFLLNSSLSVVPISGVRILDPDTLSPLATSAPQHARAVTFETTGDPLPDPLVVTYQGAMRDTLHQSENYARGFETTTGLIDSAGVFLSGSSFWIPTQPDSLFSFTLSVHLPPGWTAISQGNRVESSTGTTWICRDPMEEAYLVGGRYFLFEEPCDSIDAQVYLFEPDSGLAETYLSATCRYIDMYNDLIGSYPYDKFALVENFWQTGYGMPSFTLLGGIVIRLPFIVHTSYGHEILHNWWGNGVYVDWDSGNWCEGLTSYMADHYYKEMRGGDREYRQKVLLHYLWYASDKTDLPLTQFTERHSSSSEAVGYGKSAMVYHMLRDRFGDETFFRAIRSFWLNNKFRKASWNDLQKAFEAASAADLSTFFSQWILFPGAPSIHIELVEKADNCVRIVLSQKTETPVYDMDVPVNITQLIDDQEIKKEYRLRLNGAGCDTMLETKGDVVRLEVDPDFDVFRVLEHGEAPAGLGHLFGTDTTRVFVDSELGYLSSTLEKSWPTTGRMNFTSGTSNIPAARGTSDPQGIIDLRTLDDGLQMLPESIRADVDTLIRNTALDHGNTEETPVLIVLTRDSDNMPHCWILTAAAIDPDIFGSTIRKLAHYDTYNMLLFSGGRCTAKERPYRGINPLNIQFTGGDVQ